MIKKVTYIILILMFFSSKVCAKSPEEAEKFVNEVGNNLIEIVSNEDKDLDEIRQDMIDLVEPIIDSHFISKFLTRKYYHKIKTSNKKRLKLAIHNFFVISYSKKFNGYQGEQFTINNTKGSKSYYEVDVIMDTKEIKNINIAFRLRYDQKNKKFQVFDLIVEGISLLQAQKKAFESRIDAIGIEQYILELEKKTLEI